MLDRQLSIEYEMRMFGDNTHKPGLLENSECSKTK